VEGGTAHRVDRTSMGREGELSWGPQGHGAGHPSEGRLLCCQGTLEREATFSAQDKNAGVEAGESYCCGTHLSLTPRWLWRRSASTRSEPGTLDRPIQQSVDQRRGPWKVTGHAGSPTGLGCPWGCGSAYVPSSAWCSVAAAAPPGQSLS
jgi:hypothetical protein